MASQRCAPSASASRCRDQHPSPALRRQTFIRDQQICDELIPYDPKGVHRGWAAREKLAAESPQRKLDIALSSKTRFDSSLARWRAPNPPGIGDAAMPAALCPRPSLSPSRRNSAHEKFYYLELIRRAVGRANSPTSPNHPASPGRRPPRSEPRKSLSKRRQGPRRPAFGRRRRILRFRQMLATQRASPIF